MLLSTLLASVGLAFDVVDWNRLFETEGKSTSRRRFDLDDLRELMEMEALMQDLEEEQEMETEALDGLDQEVYGLDTVAVTEVSDCGKYFTVPPITLATLLGTSDIAGEYTVTAYRDGQKFAVGKVKVDSNGKGSKEPSSAAQCGDWQVGDEIERGVGGDSTGGLTIPQAPVTETYDCGKWMVADKTMLTLLFKGQFYGVHIMDVVRDGQTIFTGKVGFWSFGYASKHPFSRAACNDFKVGDMIKTNPDDEYFRRIAASPNQ